MLAFIGRRLAVIAIILLGSSFLVYNLEAIAADPLEDIRNSTAQNKDFLIAAMTRKYNLDVPPPARYFIWLKGVLGVFWGAPNLGKTLEGQKVVEAISNAIPITVRLVLAATIIAIVLGITIGVVTAIRQYSRFDYSMTFVSFLLFSLPIFWVAVLLKQFLAIQFNDFLEKPHIPITFIIPAALIFGWVLASAIGGERKRYWTSFGTAALAAGLVLFVLDITQWFSNPGLGPIVITILGAGFAFGVTAISVGLGNRRALYSSLTMAGLGLVLYYPLQMVFATKVNGMTLLGLFAALVVAAVASGYFWSKVDKGSVIRTTLIVAFMISLLHLFDRMLQAFPNYYNSDSINRRPVPTVNINNPLLSEKELSNFWVWSLDTTLHMLLPTIALTLISFAGYVRYSRGSLLEVLNMDYIRTARAKGLSERTVIVRHALRNAMIPLTTLMAWDFAGVIGGAIITERVFSWKGMGTLFNQAIGMMDLNLLMGVFVITSFMAVLANLVADLLYTALDPRIRVK